MDAPPIQYARTADGASIAYTAVGEGPPLVYLQPFTHQQLDWTVPAFDDWFTALAARHRLIRYDSRGFGLSQRTDDPLSLDTHLADLTAVVDAVGLKRFHLIGISGLGRVAIAYTLRSPERVERLALWGMTPARDHRPPRLRAIYALTEIDPESADYLLARGIYGDAGALRDEAKHHYKETVPPGALQAYLEGMNEIDVMEWLPRIVRPTLVILPRDAAYSTMAALQSMAAQIPECEVLYAPGEIYPHIGAGAEERLRLLERFFASPPADRADAADPPGFRTLMFTDLESSTALTQAVGDQAAQDVLRGHNEVVRAALEAHGGEEVKHTGDGIFAAFTPAVSAVEATTSVKRIARNPPVAGCAALSRPV